MYTTLSGYWGGVVTDFFQFALAMFGAITLMVIVLIEMGGPGPMVEQVLAAPGVEPKVLHFVPDFRTATNLAIITFVVQVSLLWWGGGQGIRGRPVGGTPASGTELEAWPKTWSTTATGCIARPRRPLATSTHESGCRPVSVVARRLSSRGSGRGQLAVPTLRAGPRCRY